MKALIFIGVVVLPGCGLFGIASSHHTHAVQTSTGAIESGPPKEPSGPGGSPLLDFALQAAASVLGIGAGYPIIKGMTRWLLPGLHGPVGDTEPELPATANPTPPAAPSSEVKT